jgi:hypothetical protein
LTRHFLIELAWFALCVGAVGAAMWFGLFDQS